MKFRPDGSGVAFGKAAERSRTLELGPGWALAFRDAEGNEALIDYAWVLAHGLRFAWKLCPTERRAFSSAWGKPVLLPAALSGWHVTFVKSPMSSPSVQRAAARLPGPDKLRSQTSREGLRLLNGLRDTSAPPLRWASPWK